jgi:Flp pilus assembly protein CpaB
MKKGIIAVLLAAAVVVVGAAAARAGDAPSEVVKGYRAVAVPLSGYQLAFVKKGDRIDVLVTFEAQMKDGKEKVTATILQNIVVLDVQKPTELTATGTVNLIVNPNEAQYLALAEKQGDLNISVRAEGDTHMDAMEMASFRKLFK